MAQLSGGVPDKGLQDLVNGMSLEVEERVHDILDDIPGDVKERANILLNHIGGRSLGTCPCHHDVHVHRPIEYIDKDNSPKTIPF